MGGDRAECAGQGGEAPADDDDAASAFPDDLLGGLKLADLSALDTFGSRDRCPRCGTKYCRFCVNCLYLHPGIRQVLPPLKLPVKLDILKHAGERNTKSTALHAKVVCPEDVTVYSYPHDHPRYDDPQRVLLLFPGKEAIGIRDAEQSSYDRVLVLDGSWSQARGMMRHQTWLQKLRKVTVSPRRTLFWRYQNAKREDDTFLATIEGIYYLYREHWEGTHPGRPYDGEYDNLLYFYKHNYDLIQKVYRASPGKKFSWRHKDDYIKYDDDGDRPPPGVVVTVAAAAREEKEEEAGPPAAAGPKASSSSSSSRVGFPQGTP